MQDIETARHENAEHENDGPLYVGLGHETAGHKKASMELTDNVSRLEMADLCSALNRALDIIRTVSIRAIVKTRTTRRHQILHCVSKMRHPIVTIISSHLNRFSNFLHC